MKTKPAVNFNHKCVGAELPDSAAPVGQWRNLRHKKQRRTQARLRVRTEKAIVRNLIKRLHHRGG